MDGVLARRQVAETQRPEGQQLWESCTLEGRLGTGDRITIFSVLEVFSVLDHRRLVQPELRGL